MTFQEIQELIKLLNKSNLSEFKLKDGEFQISIRTSSYHEGKTTQVVSAPAPVMHPVAAPVPAVVPVTAAPEPVSAEPRADTSSAPPASQAANGAKMLEVKSPMVGTFYRAANPDKPPFVEIGSKIKKGDVVCVIEAMKLFNEIESEVGGTIVKVLVGNSQPVEYDQPLFIVEPE